MNLTTYGFGAMTRAQTDAITNRLATIDDSLLLKRRAIEAAERAGGFPQREIDAAFASVYALEDERNELAASMPERDAEAGQWATFIRALEDLERRVAAFEPGFLAQRRTKMLIGATLGTLAIVGLLTWGIWRYSMPKRGTAGLRGGARDGTWGYLANDKQVFIPDTRVTVRSGDQPLVLKGNGHTMAVRRAGRIVGYTTSDDLGYPTVKAWMAAHPGRGLHGKRVIALPTTSGESVRVDAHGTFITVKKKRPGEYVAFIGASPREHARWGDAEEIRSDVEYFLSTGALPRSGGRW